MSYLLSDLVGHKCLVRTEDDEYLSGSPELPCRVTGADEEWLRVSFVDGAGERMSRMARIEDLCDILIFEE
jgi:hypothetical protein